MIENSLKFLDGSSSITGLQVCESTYIGWPQLSSDSDLGARWRRQALDRFVIAGVGIVHDAQRRNHSCWTLDGNRLEQRRGPAEIMREHRCPNRIRRGWHRRRWSDRFENRACPI